MKLMQLKPELDDMRKELAELKGAFQNGIKGVLENIQRGQQALGMPRLGEPLATTNSFLQHALGPKNVQPEESWLICSRRFPILGSLFEDCLLHNLGINCTLMSCFTQSLILIVDQRTHKGSLHMDNTYWVLVTQVFILNDLSRFLGFEVYTCYAHVGGEWWGTSLVDYAIANLVTQYNITDLHMSHGPPLADHMFIAFTVLDSLLQDGYSLRLWSQFFDLLTFINFGQAHGEEY
eukprot:Gb_33587 [translate_table: standard]